MTKQLQATLAAIMVISAISVPAQTTSATPAHTTSGAKSKKKAPRETPTERQIRELREQMQNQQAEIDSLKAQSAAKDAALAAAQQASVNAQTVAAAASSQAQTVNATVQANADAVASLQGTVTDLKNSNTGLALTISDTKKDLSDKIENPTEIHYKSVTLKPYGFVAAETVYRSRAINSDINTPFNSTPYGNSPQAYLSEFNASGRQSRLGLLVNTKPAWGHLGAYYEVDFLSAGETSNDNQTNSYTMRQRQAWAQAATNKGFTITGGQIWSTVTELKSGINSAPGIEALPNTIDPQYHVGFSFTRQYGIRLAQTIGQHQAVALGIEESQTVLAGSTNLPYNFFFGGEGNTGGLYASTGNGSSGTPGAQNYSNNVAPDLIVKYEADAKYGHFEAGGIARFFRDRYYPTLGYVTAAPTSVPTGTGTNDTVLGGGFFVNARVKATKFADVGVHILQGDGTGRYGTSNLGDVTVKPNGTLEPLRNSQGLATLEFHPTPKLDVYGYAGGEYLQRTFYKTSLSTTTAGVTTVTTYNVGYAPLISKVALNTATGVSTTTYGQNDTACGTESGPASNSGYTTTLSSTCSGSTRAVLEGTAGFTYRFYNSPTRGRLQYQMVYSYLTREGWTGANTANPSGVGGPKATNNMFWTSFRYYIP
jgi:hypothetical protein